MKATYDARARRDPGSLALLAAVLLEVPAMPNALCRGRTALFDRGGDDASTDAVELCSHCPELEPCANWAARQPNGSLSGVWAGTVYAATETRHRSTA
ncbi:MAG: WhiB family transcriptional regulator [Actinomycetota bacterium]